MNVFKAIWYIKFTLGFGAISRLVQERVVLGDSANEATANGTIRFRNLASPCDDEPTAIRDLVLPWDLNRKRG
jgi:hypothetical protein